MKIGIAGSSLNNKDILSGSAVPLLGFINELKKDNEVLWLSSEPELNENLYSPVPIVYCEKENCNNMAKKLKLDLLILEVWSSNLVKLAREFSSYGSKVVIWDDNSPYAIYRWKEAVKYADFILTHGEGAKDILKDIFPNKKIETFFFATDTETFKPCVSLKHKSDVSFVGTNITKRLDSLKYLFFEQSKLFSNKKFNLYGNGWDRSSFLKKSKNVDYKGWIDNQSLAKIFYNSRISINGTRDGLRNTYLVPSNRVFDVMASGGVLISDPIPGIEKLFNVGKDLLIAKDSNDAYKKIKMILENDKLREEISNNARNAILKSHTWKHRKEQLMKLL